MSGRRIFPSLSILRSFEVTALFVALNAFGYDEENARSMSATRRRVRILLKEQDWARKYPELARACHAHHPWQLLTFVLGKKNKRFLDALKRFSRELIIRKAVRIAHRAEAGEARKYVRVFVPEMERLAKSFPEVFSRKKIVVIANLLDAHWRGYRITDGDKNYVVLGPGSERNRGEVFRHELFHLVARMMRLPRGLLTKADIRRVASQGYGSLSVLGEEYIVRGLMALDTAKSTGKRIAASEKDFPKLKKVIAFLLET